MKVISHKIVRYPAIDHRGPVTTEHLVENHDGLYLSAYSTTGGASAGVWIIPGDIASRRQVYMYFPNDVPIATVRAWLMALKDVSEEHLKARVCTHMAPMSNHIP